MASVSSGKRDCNQGDVSMEVEAREISCLAANAAGMSRHVTVAQRSRRAANAAEMSSYAAAAWENVSRAGDDSYRRMRALVLKQMDQISRWARLQDDLQASFEQSTDINRQLNFDAPDSIIH